MRKHLGLLAILVTSQIIHAQCPSGLSGIYKVGPGGNFASLTAALTGLRSNGLNGAVVLELRAGYTSTGETFPISFSGIGCLSASNNLVVRPETGASGLVIAANNGTAVFSLDNARYITIDGRPGGSGTTSALKITNSNQTATAVRFLNDASYNTLTYLEIQGSNSTQQGHVYFGTSNQSITNGNSFNEISHCKLTYGNFTPNLCAIYSLGSANKKNRNNTVRNCEISQFNQTGVSLQANNEAWTLDANHFFGKPGSIAPIYINDTTSSGFQVTGNFVGGTAPNCGGTAMQAIDYFTGILLYTGSNGYTSVQNNTVANISEVANNGYYFTAIHLAMGKFKCGDVQGNTIGSLSSPTSIRFGMNSINLNHFELYGILAGDRYYYLNESGIDSSIIRNNRISGIQAYQYATGYGDGMIAGIAIKSQKRGYVEISNNTIGNPSMFNSIQNITSPGPNSVAGIYIGYADPQGNGAKNLVKDNLITNLNGNCIGVHVVVAAADVINNTIKGLYANYFPTDNGGAMGILMSNCPQGLTVSGNTIHTLDVRSQSPYVCGIELTYTSNALVERNNIHTLQATPTLNVSTYVGIEVNYSCCERIQNNMIRLGIDSSGAGINGNHLLKGINLVVPNSTVTHNSIYIGGNGNTESVALDCNNYPQTITNNILYNARSITATTLQSHYAFKYAGDSIHRLGLNNNIYYATGNQGFLATVYRFYSFQNAKTIDEWRSLSKSDSNSISYNPNFILPNGNVTTGNLHLAQVNPAEGQASFDPLAATDIDGDHRTANSPSDIGADEGNFTLQDGDAPVIKHELFLGQVISEAQPYAVQITDNGAGVDSSGNNKPRMWFRKKFPATSAWASVTGSLQSGTIKSGTWTFIPELSLTGAPYSPGDSLEYYFVAQDKGPLINIGYSNKNGTVHPTVSSQASAPSTPLRLLLMGYFPDTVYVGSGQTYTSLTNTGGFFEAANKMIFHPATVNPVVYITSDLEGETASFSYTNLSKATHTIRLMTPTATVKKVVSTNAPTRAMVYLNNVHDLVIDGRVNGSGRYLQFTSGYSNPIYSRPALNILNGERIVIRSCIFESNLKGYEGVVNVNSVLNKHLYIQDNLVRNIESGVNPGIPDFGITVYVQKGDTIHVKRNEITNFGLTGLKTGQGVNNPTIRLIVDSNHFYYNSAVLPTGSRTAISQGLNIPIITTNNYIGGSAPFAGGTPWTFPTQVSGASFIGIELELSKDSISTVSNNIIRNIHFTNFGYMFYGIKASSYSSVRIKDNIVGDASRDSSILNKHVCYGIYGYIARHSGFSPLVDVTNNEIAGITAPTIEGIYLETPNGIVQNNRIHRLHTSGFATGIPGYKGMKIWLERGFVLNNEVSDIWGENSNQGYNYGIDIVSLGALNNELVVERNRVSRIYTSGESNTSLVGMRIGNGQLKIRNNTISLTNGNNPSTAQIYGMQISGFSSVNFQTFFEYNSVYIGGSASNSAKSAALHMDASTPVMSMRNNLLYNERTGSGSHLAVWVLPPSGNSNWTRPNIANNNLYVVRDTALMHEWPNTGITGMAAWRGITRSDSASFASTVAILPPGLFTGAVEGDLHINKLSSLGWYVNGKGMPLAGVSGDLDSASGVRSTLLTSGATDIGADEFTTSSLPPSMTVTGNHVPGGSDTLSFNGHVYAVINWGNSGTLPTLGETRFYSGSWPMDSTNNGTAFFAQYLNGWWDIPASGGSNYTYSLTLFYDSAMLGTITDPSSMVINKRQSGVPGSWVALSPTTVDTLARTITIYNQTSFSQFTASDGQATLQNGIAAPELEITWKEISSASISTGNDFTVRFIQKNKGTAAAGAHRVNIYLSSDALLTPGNNGDSLIGHYEFTGGLASNTSTDTLSKTLKLPCGFAAGNYHIIFMTDALEQVNEGDENNNSKFQPIDLVIGLVMPATPVINPNPSATVCTGTTVSLEGTSANCTSCTYNWDGPGGQTTGPNRPATVTGNYTLTISNGCGSVSAIQSVTVHPKPELQVTHTLGVICAGSVVSMQASGAQSYSWSGPGLSSNGSTVNFTPTAAGPATYQVTGTSNGCSDVEEVILNVRPAALVQVGNDTTICTGGSATLMATGNASGYQWQPGNNNNASYTVQPASNTVYTVVGTTVDGCSAADQVMVSVAPAVTPAVTISSSGCSSGSIIFTANAGNGGATPSYQWYVNGAPVATGNPFTLNNPVNGMQVYVQLSSSQACATPVTVSSTISTVSCVSTALPVIEGLQSFRAGPNPVKGRLYIQMKLTVSRLVSFELTDLTGRTVYRSVPRTVLGTYDSHVDVRGFSGGVYFLQVWIGKKRFTEKIVLGN